MPYVLNTVPELHREEVTQALDNAWADREMRDMRRGSVGVLYPTIIENADAGLEWCPICLQLGVVMIDTKGTKIEHAYRQFSCRVGFWMNPEHVRQRVNGVLFDLDMPIEEFAKQLSNPEHFLKASYFYPQNEFTSWELAFLCETAQKQGLTWVTISYLLTGYQKPDWLL